MHFILDHFDTFFSVVVHGNKIELEVCMRSFNRIHKGNIGGLAYYILCKKILHITIHI